MVRWFVVFLFAVGFASGARAQNLAAPSSWVSEHGSILKITAWDATAKTVTGLYINNTQGFECRGKPFDLAGTSAGRKITFKVVWKDGQQDCKADTVWNGTVNPRAIGARYVFSYVDRKGRPAHLRGTDVFTKR